jgi:hypothetical protein
MIKYLHGNVVTTFFLLNILSSKTHENNYADEAKGKQNMPTEEQ